MPLYKEQQYSTTRRLSERTRVKQLKKSISFYYVMSANKPPPSVPSDQGFYQLLWDDPDRSNRLLKQKANKRAISPPTKKAKASSPLTRAVSPDSSQSSQSSHEMPSPSHKKMPSPSDPQTFQCALDMLVTAWKEKYPTVKFPIKSVCFLPMSKRPLAPQPTTKQGHQHSVQVDCGRNIQLSSGHVVSNVTINYCLVVNSNLSRFRRDRAFVSALKKVVSMKQNTPTNHTRHLLGAFAASHPQISTIYQEQIIALARFSLLLEVKAVVEYGDTSW
jgi:hypothetical protein